MTRPSSQRGFTIWELGALIVIASVVAAVFILGRAGTRHGCGNRNLKDSAQLRGVHQAMVFWAQNNKDCSPLPSLVDPSNTTVPEVGAAKDTTSNILSILVWNGSINPE